MKKYSLLSIVLLYSATLLAQGPEIKIDLPTVIPPAPTTAGLMKFEEVPVSYYTGVPDISIPLFTTEAKYGLDFNMSLNYHPGNIKKDDIAGFTGLGWSLIAGGTISRTVRDIPDDFYGYIGSGTSAKLKVGIYHNESTYGHSQNNYYSIIDSLPSNHNFNYESEEINRFFFESHIKGLFDTKHDLYQFNFMGYTGRFIIEKKPNGSFEVAKLDKNNLIINYDATNKTFTIKDTKGFTYIFDIKEETKGKTLSYRKMIDDTVYELETMNTYDYISGFQLSKVKYGNNLVLDFEYHAGTLSENQIIYNETHNIPIFPLDSEGFRYLIHHGSVGNLANVMLPSVMRQNISTLSKTKKIKRINVIDKAVIDLVIKRGLDTEGMVEGSLNHQLESIKVRTWDTTTVVKEFKFDYLMAHKMFLSKINEGPSSNELTKYQFTYQDMDLEYTDFESDYWGYYRKANYDANCGSIYFHKRDADKAYCKKDVLKQIIYPTKGSVIFEYEPNNYSFIGEDDSYYTEWSENNFDANPNNWTTSEELDNFILDDSNQGGVSAPPDGHIIHPLFGGNTLSTEKILIFTTSITEEEGPSFLFLKKIDPSDNSATSTSINTSGCHGEFPLEAGYKYSIDFHWIDATVLSTAAISYKEKTRNSTTERAEIGGGIRIKNIYYTEDDATEILAQDFPDHYSKKTNYSYNFFDDVTKSSGSLVYPKPKLQYEDTKLIDFVATGAMGMSLTFNKIKYSIFSTTNNLSFLSTKGSDVGYKNVTVSESGNGRTEYTYHSPINHPEIINYVNIAPPFASTPNIDYKRGLLTDEKKYSEAGRILAEKHSEYLFEDHEVVTGINTYTMPGNDAICYDCPYANHYQYYYLYREGYNDPETYCCVPNPTTREPMIVGQLRNYNVRSCGSNAYDFVTYSLQKEAFGWAKLKSTLSKDYFYDASNVQTQVEKFIEYTYNDSNMQLASQEYENSVGDMIRNDYYYVNDTECDLEPEISGLRSDNRVDTLLKTEKFKGTTTKLSEEKVIYKDWGNSLFVPEIIQSCKGTLPLENRIQYNEVDNSNGHPLEVQQADGTKISYIWGYHKSQPIAKLENFSLSTLAGTTTVANLQSLSNLDVDSCNSFPCSGTEENLRTALNTLRAAYPSAMITTYTYDPLIGITSETDPRGNTTYYSYDSFGRLKSVTDAQGNKLSENEYHYRPQN